MQRTTGEKTDRHNRSRIKASLGDLRFSSAFTNEFMKFFTLLYVYKAYFNCLLNLENKDSQRVRVHFNWPLCNPYHSLRLYMKPIQLTHV